MAYILGTLGPIDDPYLKEEPAVHAEWWEPFGKNRSYHNSMEQIGFGQEKESSSTGREFIYILNFWQLAPSILIPHFPMKDLN